jgi:hypothetical protein
MGIDAEFPGITFELDEGDRQEPPIVFISGNFSENTGVGGLLLNIPFLHVKMWLPHPIYENECQEKTYKISHFF